MTVSVLVLYDRKGAAIEALANAASEGVKSTGIGNAILKRIEEAHRSDLLDADAVMLGSPNWSGVTGSLKLWLDEQGDLWKTAVWQASRVQPLAPDGGVTRAWKSHYFS